MSGAEVTIATKLRRLIKKLGASKRKIAKRMGTSTGQLLRILDPKYMGKVKLRSLERVAEALGYRLELTLVLEQEQPVLDSVACSSPDELRFQGYSESDEYVEVDSDTIVFANKYPRSKGQYFLEGIPVGAFDKAQFEDTRIEDLSEANAILYITWLLERDEEAKAEDVAFDFARINPKTLGPVSSLTVHVYKIWLMKEARARIQSEETH